MTSGKPGVPRSGQRKAGLGAMPGPWAEDAACASSPYKDAWHPEGEKTKAIADTEYALAVCALCPVRAQCLEFAMNQAPIDCQGIWGGLTETQRENLRKRNRRAA
jgi:WhiB family redox-sensing transcriptional regulator